MESVWQNCEGEQQTISTDFPVPAFTRSQQHLERLMVRYETVCRHFAPVLGHEPNSL
jgi:hypothetical protein